MFQAVRGTSDLLPTQLTAYRQLEKNAVQLAEKYGFQEIRTPLFEKADLFTRGLGVMSSLIERELWTFSDKHGQKLALRADMTPCVVRAYQQHRMSKENGPTKLYYLGPVFLLGKENNEPSRQSHQFGVEVLGNGSPALETELLVMALEFCETVGVIGLKTEINSLGCDKCRPAYYDALREFFSSRQNELCHNCKRKYRSHPTWVLSCTEASCAALSNLAPTILGLLCHDCKTHFNVIKHLLQELELEISFNPRVVKDQEYYNSTVFRISANERTLGMGGRYDGLTQHLGGSDTPAAGFAIYLDELITLLPETQIHSENLDFIFLPEGPESTKALLPVALKLRKSGARVEILYQNSNNLPTARWHIKLAEITALRGQVEIIDQESNQQEKCNTERLLARLQHLISQGSNEVDEDSRGMRRRLNRTRNRDRDRESSRRVHEETPVANLSEPEVESDEITEKVNERQPRRRHARHRDEEKINEAKAYPHEDSQESPPANSYRDETVADEHSSEDRLQAERPRERSRSRERLQRRDSVQEIRPQPTKAFIPSLSLAGVKVAPPPVTVKATPKVEEIKPAVPVASAASATLNWSIKTRTASPDLQEEAGNIEENQNQYTVRRQAGRRR